MWPTRWRHRLPVSGDYASQDVVLTGSVVVSIEKREEGTNREDVGVLLEDGHF